MVVINIGFNDFFHFWLDDKCGTFMEKVDILSNMQRTTIILRCAECDFDLDIFYCDIIEGLSKAGLLPENYRHLCCDCYE